MDSKIVFVALVLIASFALPTLAAHEKDFISLEAVKAILKKTNANAMPSEDAITALTGKTVISSAVLDQVFRNGVALGGHSGFCFETCIVFGCATSLVGCSCTDQVCTKKSLAM